MKLYKYSHVEHLNKALEKFEKEGVRIAKVKIITAGDRNTIIYYILTDDKNNYQPNEAKTNVG